MLIDCCNCSIPNKNKKKTDSTDVTSEFSKLVVNLNWVDEFYFFIKNVILASGGLYHIPNWSDDFDSRRRTTESGSISISSDLITKDLLSLIEDSLYIHELATLSLSIPTEAYTFNLTNFGIFITRVVNDTINATVGSVSVTIPSDDTDGFTDIIIVSLDGLGGEETLVDGGGAMLLSNPILNCDGSESVADTTTNNDINNGSGVLASDEVIITVLSGSNNTAIHNLTQDIVITFENVDFNILGNDSQQLCVWYNETDDSWNTDGCEAELIPEESTVICYCSHLTKFAVMTTLSEHETAPTDCTEDELGLRDYLSVFCSIFFVGFISILCYICHKMKVLSDMNLLHKVKEKQESFNALVVCGICALLQSIGCVMLAIYAEAKSFHGNSVYVESLTLFLALPLLFYFIMFTQALQGWMLVSSSVNSQDSGSEEKKKLVFNVINLLVAFIFSNLAVLLIFDADSQYPQIFLYGEIVWLSLMGFACMAFGFYSIKLRKILSQSLKVVQSVQDKRSLGEQKRTIRRLTIVSVLLSLFFTLQTLIGVYGVYVQVSETNYDISLAIFDLFLNLMYLGAFLYLYIPNINRIVHSERRSYVTKTNFFLRVFDVMFHAQV